MKRSLFIISVLSLFSCANEPNVSTAQKELPLIDYVNPFIGTGGHGHTYPGATMPFGMMQLSPDTRLDGWDGCSGYHYSDEYIYGFSHTHLSGTGVSDYGDILLMPTNTINFNNGANGKKGYRAHFSHANEIAAPGYYKVKLDTTNIEVELTVSKRSGMHKYQFPSAENQIVILDLIHRDKVLDANIDKISDTEIQGYRFSDAWATDQRLYFYIKTSHSFNDILQSPPEQGMPGARKTALTFNNPNNELVYIKIGISAVDEEGARKNLEEEIADKSFEDIKKEAQDTWEQQLEKIVIESSNSDYKTNFYTSLYHTMIAPNLYQDVDGRYRGMDLEIHTTKDFDYYTVFSLWDTYRATHPLYTIIEQERTNDFINTLLAKYDEGGILPIWDLSSNYTDCMIGYHAVPVIADAYLKGIRDYDTEKAFQAMKHSAFQDKLGLKSYKEFGFVPMEEESESVSKTLEYAYDDWTIAQMAKAMNKEDDYALFSKRAQFYKNVYDPETQFMRGRFRNTWFTPFDPYEVNFNYTEANAWQYSLYVPQDITGLMNLMGGKKVLENHLDNLFTANNETSGRDQIDITGLIGQYAHGNEPSHHMAYLYNFVNKPAKTQEKVYQILTELYKNDPDGVSGNEDCGQMSAWYVLSSLGFYPVTPGANQYIIGSPLFEKATLNLENKKQFTIQAENISDSAIYIEKAFLNDIELNRTFITHNEIIAGGILKFYMTDAPNNWGTQEGHEPKTEIKEHLIIPTPFIAEGKIAFKNDTQVSLANSIKETTLYYSIDSEEFKIYENPINITTESQLKTYAALNGIKSDTLKTNFYKINSNISIQLETEYANQYNAGGNNALIDGIRGSKDYRTGAWQGYQDADLIAIIDLGSIQAFETVELSFLQDQRSWIFFPTEVTCYVAPEKIFSKNVPAQIIAAEVPSSEIEIKTIRFNTEGQSSRYIKIVAKNLGDLPNWHLGSPYKGKAWIFIDEITIK
ncbi:MAG: glycoside hydrolase family 92 protein [Flavobacteriaceae bacterium]|jgi:predicted alpha-1,2-mannosidase|nr:glycoside hydrolase family 92 protein [Flavobacteriaceae bacterium]